MEEQLHSITEQSKDSNLNGSAVTNNRQKNNPEELKKQINADILQQPPNNDGDAFNMTMNTATNGTPVTVNNNPPQHLIEDGSQHQMQHDYQDTSHFNSTGGGKSIKQQKITGNTAEENKIPDDYKEAENNYDYSVPKNKFVRQPQYDIKTGQDSSYHDQMLIMDSRNKDPNILHQMTFDKQSTIPLQTTYGGDFSFQPMSKDDTQSKNTIKPPNMVSTDSQFTIKDQKKQSLDKNTGNLENMNKAPALVSQSMRASCEYSSDPNKILRNFTVKNQVQKNKNLLFTNKKEDTLNQPQEMPSPDSIKMSYKSHDQAFKHKFQNQQNNNEPEDTQPNNRHITSRQTVMNSFLNRETTTNIEAQQLTDLPTNMLAVQRETLEIPKNQETKNTTVQMKDKKIGWFGIKSLNKQNNKNQITALNPNLLPKVDDASSSITKETHHMPPSLPIAQNLDQYIDVSVFTQNKEDCQWGIFDFSSIQIDKNSGKLKKVSKSSDDSSKEVIGIESWNFQIKGTSYITRESKFRMCQTFPHESSNQIEMGAISVMQNPNSYMIYQNTDLNLDFTKQIKRSDDFISKQLKDLSKKSYMVIASSNNLGKFQETNVFDKTVAVTKRGAIIRSGDIIKVGRVPIMIKESSIDGKRFEALKEQQKININTPRHQIVPPYFDIKSDADHSERSLLVSQNNNLQNMLRNATVNTDVHGINENRSNQSVQNLLSQTNNNQNFANMQGIGMDQESYLMQNLYQQQSASSLDEPMNNMMMNPQSHLNSYSNPSAVHQQFGNSQVSGCEQPNALQTFMRNQSVMGKTDLQVIQEEKKKQKAKEDSIRSCRICLCEEGEGKSDDPIISPCQCKGFSGDIHIKCLQEWLNQKRKVTKMGQFQDNYIYKKSQCEVCGSLYPDMVDVGGKLYSIFDFKRPKNQNYIIIEVLGMPVGKNFSVIKIPDNYIIEVGRSGSELNIPDVSVSKKQATLKYDLSINELVLTDINSKYGTHILIQRPIELKLNHPMYFLNGLSLIQLNLKRIQKNKCLECFPSQKKNKYKYVKDYKGLYNDVKHQMPEDLLKYENDEQSNTIINNKLFDKERFKDVSIHLMPLALNAFYTKVMKVVKTEEQVLNQAISVQDSNMINNFKSNISNNFSTGNFTNNQTAGRRSQFGNITGGQQNTQKPTGTYYTTQPTPNPNAVPNINFQNYGPKVANLPLDKINDQNQELHPYQQHILSPKPHVPGQQKQDDSRMTYDPNSSAVANSVAVNPFDLQSISYNNQNGMLHPQHTINQHDSMEGDNRVGSVEEYKTQNNETYNDPTRNTMTGQDVGSIGNNHMQTEMCQMPDFTKSDIGMMLNQTTHIIDDNSNVTQDDINIGKVRVMTTNEAEQKAFIQIHDQNTQSDRYDRKSKKKTPRNLHNQGILTNQQNCETTSKEETYDFKNSGNKKHHQLMTEEEQKPSDFNSTETKVKLIENSAKHIKLDKNGLVSNGDKTGQYQNSTTSPLPILLGQQSKRTSQLSQNSQKIQEQPSQSGKKIKNKSSTSSVQEEGNSSSSSNSESEEEGEESQSNNTNIIVAQEASSENQSSFLSNTLLTGQGMEIAREASEEDEDRQLF